MREMCTRCAEAVPSASQPDWMQHLAGPIGSDCPGRRFALGSLTLVRNVDLPAASTQSARHDKHVARDFVKDARCHTAQKGLHQARSSTSSGNDEIDIGFVHQDAKAGHRIAATEGRRDTGGLGRQGPSHCLRIICQGRSGAFASDCAPHWAPVGDDVVEVDIGKERHINVRVVAHQAIVMPPRRSMHPRPRTWQQLWLETT